MSESAAANPQKLEALNQYPDFNNYLVYVFTKVGAGLEQWRPLSLCLGV